MAENFIGIDPQATVDLNRISKKLIKLGRADIAEKATDAVSEYLKSVFQVYPVQKSVKRKIAYPETGNGFFSVKQQRYFFWALKNKCISVPYRRTGNYVHQWKIVGSGLTQILANESPYAGYLQSDTNQSRMAKLIGWHKLADAKRRHANQTKLEEIVLAVVRREIKKAF